MKNIIFSTAIILIITLNGVTPNVNGAEIEGIRFEKTYEADGVRLRIQGTGLLKYLEVV